MKAWCRCFRSLGALGLAWDALRAWSRAWCWYLISHILQAFRCFRCIWSSQRVDNAEIILKKPSETMCWGFNDFPIYVNVGSVQHCLEISCVSCEWLDQRPTSRASTLGMAQVSFCFHSSFSSTMIPTNSHEQSCMELSLRGVSQYGPQGHSEGWRCYFCDVEL